MVINLPADEGDTGSQFSLSVMSHSLRPSGLQHTRLPCPPLSPRACSNSCPSCQWCHPTISSSVIPFSSHLQSFPASGSFPISQFFTSGGQSIGVSASASFFPMNIQDWSPLGLTGWISLQFKGLSRVFSTPQFKSINSSALSLLYSPTLTSIPNWTIMEAQRRYKRGKNSLSPSLFIYLSIYLCMHTHSSTV